jgi:transposase
MARRVQVQTDLTTEELQERYRQSRDAVERTHWHMLWLLKEGKSPREVAEVLGYTARWVRTVVQRWNAQGEEGIRDQRHDIVGSPALQQPPEDAGLWSWPQVAHWTQQRLGRQVAPQRGWDYLQRLGHSTHVPRPQHAKADEATQQEFKKTARAGRPGAPRPPASGRRTVGNG